MRRRINRFLKRKSCPESQAVRTKATEVFHLLRRDFESEVEFMTILWFESMEAV